MSVTDASKPVSAAGTPSWCSAPVRFGAEAAERPLADALHLTSSRWGSIPKTYIVCAQDRALPPGAQHWWCERAPEVKKRLMDTDHSPFYSDPEGLAAIIDEEARLSRP